MTTTSSSHQNGKPERNIQTAEADIRAMLEESGLPIEFWDEAGEYDAYVRNRTQTGPAIDGMIVSPFEAYIGLTPTIEHLKVWGSLCFTYANPKDAPANSRHDKLVPTGRRGVFMGYSSHTTKHFKAYSPDLGRVHRSSRMKIDENVKGGTIDLKLRGSTGPQGTPNELPNRMSVGRPKKQDEKALTIT